MNRRSRNPVTISRTRSIVYVVVGLLLSLPIFLFHDNVVIPALMMTVGAPMIVVGIMGRRRYYPSSSTTEADLARIRYVEEMKLRGGKL